MEYTQHYNYLKKTDGPLFRGRYKAINIEASSYLLEVSRYIHRNPVETAKPLVEQLEAYQWSSYPAYRNHCTRQEWLYKESVLAELGSGQPTSSYKRFVEQGVDEETKKRRNEETKKRRNGEVLYQRALAGSTRE